MKCVRVLTVTNYQEERVKIIYVEGEKLSVKFPVESFAVNNLHAARVRSVSDPTNW